VGGATEGVGLMVGEGGRLFVFRRELRKLICRENAGTVGGWSGGLIFAVSVPVSVLTRVTVDGRWSEKLLFIQIGWDGFDRFGRFDIFDRFDRFDRFDECGVYFVSGRRAGGAEEGGRAGGGKGSNRECELMSEMDSLASFHWSTTVSIFESQSPIKLIELLLEFEQVPNLEPLSI